MSLKKSEFLKAAGKFWQIFKALTDEVLSLGGDDEAIGLIETDGNLRREIANLVMAAAKAVKEKVKIVSEYLESAWDAVVDCGQDLAQMISAGGYDYVNPDITAEHFPLAKGSAELAVKVELLHFNCYFNNGDEVIAKLKAANEWLAEQGAGYCYRFVQIEELLALGAAHRDLQRKYPIAALGSIWRAAGGGRRFASLDGFARARDLYLNCLEDFFSGVWRFAVVREQSS